MHPYMRRRQKKEAVTYPHPSLEPVLKRTLGVPLFQEQLLRMAMTVANFSGAEAEELRRGVGMRRSWERMKNLEGKLRSGMTANGIDLATQENIIQNISSFALYGFPESHAASFALIAYASAYLKVKYLAAFTCAILNNQPMGFYMPAVLLAPTKVRLLHDPGFLRCLYRRLPVRYCHFDLPQQVDHLLRLVLFASSHMLSLSSVSLLHWHISSRALQ
jgi:DNA polymerase III alpha subunit